MRRTSIAFAVLLSVVFSIYTLAQTSNATLGGTVSDPTGALIPGVTITATNIGTAIVSTVLTNESGAYQFASLQTGTYRVSAELNGFRTQTYNDVALGISQQVRPDLVEEVRVITAPVDAEMGRGNGQVQMSTRSGTNQYRGSVFWNNRNSALDASNWFNNFNGVQKDYENRNQFGARFGGPLIKNKTFFFVLVDEQRDLFKQTFVGTVLTQQARQGVFRFFPGADNQNATQNNPTVDRNGNPVRPPAATADLQQFSVFGRDPNRPGYD